MKTLNTIIIALLSIFIISCDKDNEPKQPNVDFDLEQTYWEGKYIDTANGIAKEYDVRITFKNEYKEDNKDIFVGGSYTILNFNSEDEYYTPMLYKTNDKILSIIDSGEALSGDWWKISGDKNQLILQRGLESTTYTSKLIISRKKI